MCFEIFDLNGLKPQGAPSSCATTHCLVSWQASWMNFVRSMPCSGTAEPPRDFMAVQSSMPAGHCRTSLGTPAGHVEGVFQGLPITERCQFPFWGFTSRSPVSSPAELLSRPCPCPGLIQLWSAQLWALALPLCLSAVASAAPGPEKVLRKCW